MSVAPAPVVAALADRYRVERELGRGGMATVYLIHDLKHRRPVALKVLAPQVGSALGEERFLREIEVAAGLQHPNIVTVFDSGADAGHLWFTMPFVEGWGRETSTGPSSTSSAPWTSATCTFPRTTSTPCSTRYAPTPASRRSPSAWECGPDPSGRVRRLPNRRRLSRSHEEVLVLDAPR